MSPEDITKLQEEKAKMIKAAQTTLETAIEDDLFGHSQEETEVIYAIYEDLAPMLMSVLDPDKLADPNWQKKAELILTQHSNQLRKRMEKLTHAKNSRVLGKIKSGEITIADMEKSMTAFAETNLSLETSLSLEGNRRLEENLLSEYGLYLDYLRKAQPDGHAEVISYMKHKYSVDLTPPPQAKTKYPKEKVSPTDVVSDNAFKGQLVSKFMEPLDTGTTGKKTPKAMKVKACVNIDEIKSATINKNLTLFDREVHDSIVSLWADGNDIISNRMVYQAMTGDPNARLKPGPMMDAISASIEKCQKTMVQIDATEEGKAYGYGHDETRYRGYLIPSNTVTGILNGVVVEDCLEMINMPTLFKYARGKKQISRYDIALLNSPVRKDEETIVLQGYLMRRIQAMKSSSNMRDTIVCETMFKELEITAESDGALRNKKAKIRDKAKAIFDYWKAQDFILGYEEIRKGASIYSYRIVLDHKKL